jgi:hypothetical protein
MRNTPSAHTSISLPCGCRFDGGTSIRAGCPQHDRTFKVEGFVDDESTPECEIPVLSYYVGDDPNDIMRTSEAWLAMTLVPIPYAQRRTLGPGDAITVLKGGESLMVRGASRAEALEKLQHYLSDLLGRLDEVKVQRLRVKPVPPKSSAELLKGPP